jgi:hypothetical protein
MLTGLCVVRPNERLQSVTTSRKLRFQLSDPELLFHAKVQHDHQISAHQRCHARARLKLQIGAQKKKFLLSLKLSRQVTLPQVERDELDMENG